MEREKLMLIVKPNKSKIRVLGETENTIILSDELGLYTAHCSKKGKSLIRSSIK